MEPSRKYSFSWELLGDLKLGRPNLGPTTRVEVYRLMQFCFRDVVERHLGTEETDRLFYEAGRLAGTEFHEHWLGHITDLDQYTRQLQETLRDLRIGILRFEKADLAAGSFVLTVEEDLDCSGLPECGYEVCTYDEGFIAGLMGSLTGKPFDVREVDCWCTGDRTCRFSAEVVK